MIIRKANIGDAPLIARCVLEAVGVRNFNAAIGDDSSDSSDYETGTGEYYLDTLVVMPQYRGQGLGLNLTER